MAKKQGTGNQLSLFGAINTTQALNDQLADIERKITALYGNTYKFAAQLAQVRTAVAAGQEFTFAENPAAAKAIEQRLQAVATTLDAQLSKATERSYALGQASTENALTKALGKDKATKKEGESINADAAAEMRRRGADGHTYYTQKRGGVTTSERVWRITESTKLELEVAIQQAALEGKSPDELARTIQQYLKDPDNLFRSVRVKDPTTGEWTGEYRMSKAAQQAHTGQGVYRSAYKNALRLARTELTQAYRRAEWETYQDNPLITGYRIELSNNHTTTKMTKKGRQIVPLHDICDEMAGTQFPKSFIWTGWHPQCRCRMVPITITPDDFAERVKARHTGKLKECQPKEQTTEMPKAFTKWVEDNKHRWQQPGHAAPFFIRDNYQQGNVAKGLDTRITAELEAARLAMRNGAPTPQPITDYDTEVIELRSVATKYDLDLTRIEQLRAEGDDKKALRTSLNLQQKLWHKREGNWQTAYEDARAQLTSLMGLLATYRSQENTRDFWNLRDDIVPNYNTEIESYDPAYGGFYNDAVKSLKSIKKKLEGLYYKFEAIFKNTKLKLVGEETGRVLSHGVSRDCNIYETKDGYSIVIPKDIDKDKQRINIDTLAKNINALPEELKKTIKEVQVVDYENPDDPYWRKKYKNFSRSFATGGSGTITFYANGTARNTKAENDHTNKYLKKTMAHETGHNLDRQKGTGGLSVSDMTAWTNAMTADKIATDRISVTTYGKNSPSEDFAESCMLYHTRKAYFKKTFPNRYKIIDGLINP